MDEKKTNKIRIVRDLKVYRKAFDFLSVYRKRV